MLETLYNMNKQQLNVADSFDIFANKKHKIVTMQVYVAE